MKDYESAFSVTSKDLGEDARSRQFLTFYQREMVLYPRSNESRPVEDYCLDLDLHPVFKACLSVQSFLAAQCLHSTARHSIVMFVRAPFLETPPNM